MRTWRLVGTVFGFAACAAGLAETGDESDADSEFESASDGGGRTPDGSSGKAPKVTILSPADGSFVTGSVELRFTVNVDSRLIEEAEAQAQGVGAETAVYFGALGEFRAFLTLTDGPHTLIARARTDGAFGEARVEVTADGLAPVVTIVSPAAGDSFAGLTREIVFAASDDGIGVDTTGARLWVTGASSREATYDASSDLFRGTVVLPTGDPTVTVSVADGVGNVGSAELVVASAPRILDSVGTLEAPGEIERIALANGHAFLACGESGLAVAEIPLVGEPTLVAELDLEGAATEVAAAEERAVVAVEGQGLTVVAVNEPTAPTVIGNVSLADAVSAVALAGTVAYVGSEVGNVFVIDLESLAVGGSFAAAATGRVVALAAEKTRLYVLVGDRIDVYDLSDPYSPVFIGGSELLDDGRGFGVFDEVVVAGLRDGGLRAFDFENPEAAEEIALGASGPPSVAGFAVDPAVRAVATVATVGELVAYGFGAGPGLLGATVLGEEVVTAVGVGWGHAFVAYGATLEAFDLPPYVVETEPANGEENVARLVSGRVRFSEAMDPLGTAAVTIMDGDREVTDATTLTREDWVYVQHAGALAAAREYGLVVGPGLVDRRGTGLVPDEGWRGTFTTGEGLGSAVAVSEDAFSAEATTVDFESLPGADGRLGTEDDIDVSVPYYGLYITGEWAAVGVANFSAVGFVSLRSEETSDPATVCARSPVTAVRFDNFSELQIAFSFPVRQVGFWVTHAEDFAGTLEVVSSGQVVSGTVDGPIVDCGEGDEPAFVGITADTGIESLVLSGNAMRFDDFVFEPF